MLQMFTFLKIEKERRSPRGRVLAFYTFKNNGGGRGKNVLHELGGGGGVK